MHIALPNLTLAFVQAGDAANEATEQAVEAAPAGISPWLVLGFALLVIGLPIVLGQLIASILKLKDAGFRISVCLLTVSLSAAPFAWHAWEYSKQENPTRTYWDEVIRKGIDLAGGTNMVFRVRPDDADALTAEAMDQTVGAVARRINPGGNEEVTVRQVGSDRIEVIIPGADPGVVADKKKLMTRLGSLEFGILANQTDHGTQIDFAAARSMSPDQKEYRDPSTPTRVIAVWKAVGEKNGEAKFIDPTGGGGVLTRVVPKPRGKTGETVTEFLVMQEPESRRVTGEYLNRAYPTSDQSGRIAVGFVFDNTGSFLFQRLTSENRPRRDGTTRRLAILLDDRVHSAPGIEDIISRTGIIRGDFTQAEVTELVSVLNAGALKLPIDPDPISEATVDPLLGADVQEKGLRAIVVAAAVVVLFMLVYYRFSGFVAVACLAMNLILVMGAMVFSVATFTLPGLAGLVLTIGMAVDANVLIFERIREELNRGASLRMAIQNGFSRALTTIVDANVTTLITGVILFMIGTDQIKGFAVTLIIGIVMSMFTALYFGRLIFDIFESKRWITKLSMFSIVGQTNWDFVGKRAIAGTCSAALIIAGLVAFFARGSDKYDIDFTGGTMVTFQFQEAHEIDEVRDKLVGEFDDSITVERLTLATEDAGEPGRYFRLRTTERDAEQEPTADGDAPRVRIQDRINRAFADTNMHLKRITMEYDAPVEIVAAETAEGETAIVNPDVGGHDTVLTFSSEISEVTISDNFLAALVAGETAYDNAESLIEITGLEGEGMNAGERSVRKYNKVELRTDPIVPQPALLVALGQMQETMATQPHFEEVNSFSSSVAGEMKQAAIFAVIVSLIAIVGYIWFRFQRITFGLAAVAALVHDVLIVLGLVALCSFVGGTPIGDILLLKDFKINLPMVAAFMTIVGYSLNDTIVVFDRIREVRGKNPALTPEMVNTSLNQTLSRTLLTSITTFMVVAILYAIGGEGIHGFAFCLVLGVIVGTYSSIYVASPVLLWLMNRKQATTGAAAKTAARAKAAAAG